MEKDNFVEICIGIGMNQLFPEYIKIPIFEKEESEFICPASHKKEEHNKLKNGR